MNQDQVKDTLLRVEEAQTDFSVVFSGKQSGKVNGLYKPLSREILLHNKNFESDGQLIYTALHEYAHHLHCERRPHLPGARAHTNEFWALFHGLLEKAEEKGIYQNIFDREQDFINLTERIRDLLPKNGEIMLKFGELAIEAEALCKKHLVRFEDYIDRAVGVPRASASAAMKAAGYRLPAELGWDAMKLVAGLPKPEDRHTAIEAFRGGKSQEAVRSLVRPGESSDDPRDRLDKERTRLERTIDNLKERLSRVQGELAKLQGDQA